MSINGLGIQLNRYHIIPRTLSFLFAEDHVLLIKIAEEKGSWQGHYNGIGGHIEQGEDPLTAARREVKEEAGIPDVDLRLCGVITVDTGSRPGIGLFVFQSELEKKLDLLTSDEGEPQWIFMSNLDQYELLQDLPFLLAQTLAAKESGIPFSAQYSYEQNGSIVIERSG